MQLITLITLITKWCEHACTLLEVEDNAGGLFFTTIGDPIDLERVCSCSNKSHFIKIKFK